MDLIDFIVVEVVFGFEIGSVSEFINGDISWVIVEVILIMLKVE